MTTISKLLRGTMIAGLALAPVAALAQAGAEPAQPAAPETQQSAPEMAAPGTGADAGVGAETGAESFSDAQLESFIEATVKIQELRSTFMPQIEAAASEEDKQALAEQAQTEMKTAVEETEGLDVATYNEIGQAAQADQELNARLVAMLQERAPAGGAQPAPRDEG